MEEQGILLNDPEEIVPDAALEAVDEDWNNQQDDKPGAYEPDGDRDGEDKRETDERDDTNDAGNRLADSGSDQSFTLKHLGEVTTVGRDEVIALAQKGLDYDRIRGKYEQATAELSRAGLPDYAPAAKRQSEIREFLAEYGDNIDPNTIPREVWQSVAGGKTLLAAYQTWELKKLRAESRAVQKSTENIMRSAGSRFSAGSVKPRDAIADDWYDNV